jgi:gamma-glutamylcyclotransferase (GGCT)/AIG2-like uncharacterized protein YtfP
MIGLRLPTPADIGSTIRGLVPHIVPSEMEFTQHTPDILSIRDLTERTSGKVLMFEYGDVMAGQKHHKMMPKGPCAPAFTATKFSLWVKLEGHDSTPVALSFKSDVVQMARKRIKGELYLVEAETIIDLDNYRKNGVQFFRRQIPIIVPKSDGDVCKTYAYMYVGTKDRYKEHLEFDHMLYRTRGERRRYGSWRPTKSKMSDCPLFPHFTEFKTRDDLE